MALDREDRIRERAHEIWQREGTPDGVALDHWIQAEKEVDAELGGKAADSERDPDNLISRPPPPS
ncbi:DUF2934 domain-containing protein [Shinella sp. G-2]|uniref:DUF2934 domain-containing protein n=1 Tax=Shinella sp. G-2 TaxID=3133141 RepID=UPI003D00CCBB